MISVNPDQNAHEATHPPGNSDQSRGGRENSTSAKSRRVWDVKRDRSALNGLQNFLAPNLAEGDRLDALTEVEVSVDEAIKAATKWRRFVAYKKKIDIGEPDGRKPKSLHARAAKALRIHPDDIEAYWRLSLTEGAYEEKLKGKVEENGKNEISDEKKSLG